MVVTFQISNIEAALNWIKTCPFNYTISSMQGGYIHLKILVPLESIQNDG
jgi:hypothetical protein